MSSQGQLDRSFSTTHSSEFRTSSHWYLLTYFLVCSQTRSEFIPDRVRHHVIGFRRASVLRDYVKGLILLCPAICHRFTKRSDKFHVPRQIIFLKNEAVDNIGEPGECFDLGDRGGKDTQRIEREKFSRCMGAWCPVQDEVTRQWPLGQSCSAESTYS
jgi:hypothetical protein